MRNVQSLKLAIMGLCLAVIVAIAVFVTPTDVHAQQQTSGTPQHMTVPGVIKGQQSSDADMWRAVRSGTSGTVSIPDKKSGMLVQSGGQDWRNWQEGTLKTWAGFAILGALFILSLFFALRGRIKIDAGKSGKTVTRFTIVERSAHWLLACSFILLALTGLNITFGKSLLLPILGPDIFATITLAGKYVHNYVAFAFMVGLVGVIVLWVMNNFPTMNDVRWALRFGGLLGGGHPPAGKFNAGQKLMFWAVALCGLSISFSGWALLDPFTTTMISNAATVSNGLFGTSFAESLSPIQEQQYQSMLHGSLGVFMIVLIIAHIYIGTVGMEGALDAMTSGEVDENWAREHHSVWLEEYNSAKEGKAPPPAEAHPAE